MTIGNKTANFGPWLMSDSACNASDDWEIPVHEGRTSSSCRSIVDDVGEVVAFAVTSYEEWSDPIKEAQLLTNARLIAAAPELLAALQVAEQKLVELEQHHGGGDDEIYIEGAILTVQAAIAKATS